MDRAHFNAIPVGKDLTPVLPRFLFKTLDRLPQTGQADVVRAIQKVRDVLQNWADTGIVDTEAAGEAAEAAEGSSRGSMGSKVISMGSSRQQRQQRQQQRQQRQQHGQQRQQTQQHGQ
jgi:hypothetical protein